MFFSSILKIVISSTYLFPSLVPNIFGKDVYLCRKKRGNETIYFPAAEVQPPECSKKHIFDVVDYCSYRRVFSASKPKAILCTQELPCASRVLNGNRKIARMFHRDPSGGHLNVT